MLRIDRLRLHLPADMAPHATHIARRIGALLAQADLDGDRRLEHLRVPPVAVGAQATAEEIAVRVSQGIRDVLEKA